MKKHILEAREFSSRSNARPRIVKDYEIDIECLDKRIYTYNGESYTLSRGDVLIRRPGDSVSSVGAQKSYILTLDFSSGNPPAVYSRNIPGSLQEKTDNALIVNLPPIIRPRNPYALFEIYERLIKTKSSSLEAALVLVDEIIFLLNADLAHEEFMRLNSRSSVIDKAIGYMEKNLSAKISLDELASLVNLEKSYFIRLFKKETGSTPFKILNGMRLDRASDLLATTDMKVAEIASAIGFGTTSFFISEYKKRFGFTPNENRKNMP